MHRLPQQYALTGRDRPAAQAKRAADDKALEEGSFAKGKEAGIEEAKKAAKKSRSAPAS